MIAIPELDEVQLASLGSNVIHRALVDLVRSTAGLKSAVHRSKHERLSLEGTISECTDFLLGRTEIAVHWFNCANMRPFTADVLGEAIKNWREHGNC